MNVASLLQDSPSDDRDTRLQRQHHSQQPPPSFANLSHTSQPLPNVRRDRDKEKFVPNNVPSRPPSRPIHPPPPPSDYSPPPSFKPTPSAIPVSDPTPPEKLQMQPVDPQLVYNDLKHSDSHPRSHAQPSTHSNHSSSKHKSKSSRKSSINRHQQPSQFEVEWEVKEINDKVMQEEKKSARVSPTTSIPVSVPTPPVKPKPRPYSLGTYVFPHTPFPLTSPPTLSRHQELLFTLYIPSEHLPTTLPRRASVWGGHPIIEAPVEGKPPVTRRIYTDDSLLSLLPLHAGLCTLSEYRHSRGDLKVTFNILLQNSGNCPVRWIGCPGVGKSDAESVQSLSWGNSHDGHGVEIVAIDWVKVSHHFVFNKSSQYFFQQEGTAHRLTLPNRKARLQEYAERRGHLINIPTLPVIKKASGPDVNGYVKLKQGQLLQQMSYSIIAQYSEPSIDTENFSALIFEVNGRIG